METDYQVKDWIDHFTRLIKNSTTMFLGNISPWNNFNILLDELLKITKTEYGMIGRIIYEDNVPILEAIAVTNISWTSQLEKFIDQRKLRFRLDHQNLLLEPIAKKKTIFTNDPMNHPGSGGIPKKHKKLSSYLATPIFNHKDIIGYIGIANRENGFTKDMIVPIETLATMISGLMLTYAFKDSPDEDLENSGQENDMNNNEMNMITYALTYELVQLSDDGMIIVNKHKKIHSCNTSALEMLGYPDDYNLRDNNILDIFPHLYNFFITSAISSKKEIIIRANDKTVELQIKIDKTMFQANIYYLIKLVNITKNQTTELARSKNRERYIGVLNHELRNPLQTIAFSTELIKNSKDIQENKWIHKYISRIQKSVQIVKKVIDDVKRLYDIEIGDIILSNSTIYITELVENLIDNYKNIIKTKKIQVSYNVESSAASIYSDEYLIHQILEGIFSDCIRNTSNGSISLNISTNHLESEYYDGMVVFVFTDSGIGYKEMDIGKIFDESLHINMNDTLEDSSIGSINTSLSISNNLIRILDGTIRVQSEYGKGCKYTIKIPYPLPEGGESFIIKATTKGKILIVDDNADNRELFKEFIIDINNEYKSEIDVVSAKDGFDCIDILKTQEFDLIFMDINMPGMDGCETTAYVKKEMKLDTKIIALTGNIYIKNEYHTLHEHISLFHDIVNKPFEKRHIESIIARILGGNGDNKKN